MLSIKRQQRRRRPRTLDEKFAIEIFLTPSLKKLMIRVSTLLKPIPLSISLSHKLSLSVSHPVSLSLSHPNDLFRISMIANDNRLKIRIDSTIISLPSQIEIGTINRKLFSFSLPTLLLLFTTKHTNDASAVQMVNVLKRDPCKGKANIMMLMLTLIHF